jgi:hypothetical protein
VLQAVHHCDGCVRHVGTYQCTVLVVLLLPPWVTSDLPSLSRSSCVSSFSQRACVSVFVQPDAVTPARPPLLAATGLLFFLRVALLSFASKCEVQSSRFRLGPRA